MKKLLLAFSLLVFATPAVAQTPSRTYGIRFCEAPVNGTDCISVLPPASITTSQNLTIDNDSTPFDPLVSGQIRTLTFLLGADNGPSLTNGDDQPTIFWNRTGQDAALLEVGCEADAGTPTINLQVDDGSPADVLTSNLTCTTSGATSSGFVSGEEVLLDGEKLDFVLVSASTAKRITLIVLHQFE